MNPDETPPAGQPSPEAPPASLTAVRVGRRKAVTPTSGKPGDLTQKLGADLPADARAAIPDTVAAPTAPAPPPQAAAVIEPEPLVAAPPPAPQPIPQPQPVAAAPAPPRVTVTEPIPAPPSPPPAPAAAAAPPRLLDEDEIARLLDPPERRAAATPPMPSAPQPLMLDPDERDAAPAAPELRLVAEGPASEPAAEAPAARQPSPAAPTNSIDQIIDYWDGLRGDRPFPPLDAVDRSHVRSTWPNCLLVAYGASDTVAPKLTRIGEENGEIEYLEMVIHWILSRGQLAARRGEPMEEEKRFPVTGGNARYQLLLLPLATPEGKSEHVLCHLSRVKEVAKGGAFKRWLAS